MVSQIFMIKFQCWYTLLGAGLFALIFLFAPQLVTLLFGAPTFENQVYSFGYIASAFGSYATASGIALWRGDDATLLYWSPIFKTQAIYRPFGARWPSSAGRAAQRNFTLCGTSYSGSQCFCKQTHIPQQFS